MRLQLRAREAATAEGMTGAHRIVRASSNLRLIRVLVGAQSHATRGYLHSQSLRLARETAGSNPAWLSMTRTHGKVFD